MVAITKPSNNGVQLTGNRVRSWRRSHCPSTHPARRLALWALELREAGWGSDLELVRARGERSLHQYCAQDDIWCMGGNRWRDLQTGYMVRGHRD
jgi:hypothetical protein